MPGHRSVAWIVPPLLIAAALPAVAWSAGSPSMERHATRAPGLAWDGESGGGRRWTLAEVPSCPAGGTAGSTETSAGHGPPASATDPSRFRLSGVLAEDGSLTGWNLTAVAAGRAVRLALPPESAVRGPVNGWLALATDDGLRSEIRVVSAAAQCGRVVHASADVIRQAVIAPDGGSVLFHAVGRFDRVDRGIWRKEVHSATSIAAVLPPLTTGDAVLDDVGLIWTTEVRASHDGRGLAVESCGAEACRIRTARLGPDTAARTQTLSGRVVGLDARQVVALRDCEGAACSLAASGLADGRDRTLAGAVTSATTVVTDGRLLVAATTLDRGGAALVVIDPATGATWGSDPRRTASSATAGEATVDLRLVPVGGTLDAGAEMPPGWAAAMLGQAPWIVAIDVAAIAAGPSGEASR